MDTFLFLLKLTTALGVFNVWILRYNKKTNYRGGSATNLYEEFKTYGLSSWFMYFVGSVKILISLLFIISLFINDIYIIKDFIELYGSIIMSFIMTAAIFMHFKIKDPIKKSIPALIMLTMYLLIIIVFINYI